MGLPDAYDVREGKMGLPDAYSIPDFAAALFNVPSLLISFINLLTCLSVTIQNPPSPVPDNLLTTLPKNGNSNCRQTRNSNCR
jgi:hypothetical protein